MGRGRWEQDVQIRDTDGQVAMDYQGAETRRHWTPKASSLQLKPEHPQGPAPPVGAGICSLEEKPRGSWTQTPGPVEGGGVTLERGSVHKPTDWTVSVPQASHTQPHHSGSPMPCLPELQPVQV